MNGKIGIILISAFDFNLPIGTVTTNNIPFGTKYELRTTIMTSLTIHTIESAPEQSQPAIKNSLTAFGMLPNLHAVLASSPETLKAYQTLLELFTQTSFNAEELTVV
jgi:hypothetical protein